MRRSLLVRVVALAVLAAAGFVGAAACSASSSPNPHDNVVVDPEPEAAATSSGGDDASGPFPVVLDGDLFGEAGGYSDAVLYNNAPPDGYGPNDFCNACACSLTGGGDAGAAGYCLGGITGMTTPPASCESDASAMHLGCNPIPAACGGLTAKEACPCVLMQLTLPCFAVCEVSKTGISVYCPNP